MLSLEAKTYFDSLASSAASVAWIELDKRQREFERLEFSRGQSPGGAGFAARLAALYKESLSLRAAAIAETLKTVHQSFNSPLGEGVDAQLLDWGSRALADAYQGLEGAYARHLQQYGVQTAHIVGLDHTYALAQATVANLPRRQLWELRNVPSKRPEQPVASAPVQVTIQNSGTIGSLQTGAGSTAHVQQWIQGDTAELRSALAALRDKLQQAEDVEPDVRLQLVADVDQVCLELEQVSPNRAKLLRWLGGIGAVIGTVGSVQPAYEAVKALARVLGIPV